MFLRRKLLRFVPAALLRTACLSLPVWCAVAAEPEIRKIEMPPAGEVKRADLWFTKPPPLPRAILVLCPGANGNGLSWLKQKAWQDFASRENLALAAMHFESPIERLSDCEGYYQASKGSGVLLLEGLRKVSGQDLPVVMLGFSGGAHFITRFIAWKPERVLTWAAGGAGVLEQPAPHAISPPGVMTCGENDPRLGGALCFFKQGRAAGKPWLWVEMPRAGHNMTDEFEDFARRYFAAVLAGPDRDGLWVDIDTTQELTAQQAKAQPSLSGWLPRKELFDAWLSCHTVPSALSSSNQ